MKYVCLGYFDEARFNALSKSDQDTMVEKCLAYDDILKKNGNVVGGEALQSAANAVTIRHSGGKAVVTDGPYAETKEQIGGLFILEARDLNHAIKLVSDHPGVRIGPIEIRAVDEAFTKMINERKRA